MRRRRRSKWCFLYIDSRLTKFVTSTKSLDTMRDYYQLNGDFSESNTQELVTHFRGVLDERSIRVDPTCFWMDIMLKLYKSLVRLLLEYSNVIWGPHYIMDKYKVETIQRRATRMTSICHDLSYCDWLHYLKLPSLQYWKLRDLFLYQMIDNLI